MDIFRRMIKSSLMMIFITLILAFYLHAYIPLPIKQFFLAVSRSIKELLMFMIPWIIFISCFSAISKIRNQAIYLMGVLLLCIILSNFFSVMMAGGFSYFTVFGSDAVLQTSTNGDKLTPLWVLRLPHLIPNYVALLLAVILACIDNKRFIKNITPIAAFISRIVDTFLLKFFIPLLPLFIFGFVLKLLNDDVLKDISSFNPKALTLMILLLFTYLSALFFVCVLYGKKTSDLSKTLIAPGITAFTTMSSAAALPFSLKAAERNTNNKELSDIVMPITSNVHMIGDALCIPIMAMIILVSFGHEVPSLSSYLCFAGLFTLTKFSGAGVPGGSILVMIPVLESTLGFTPEMTALITIFYMLIDPITSFGNVIGNNLAVILFSDHYHHHHRSL